jgi:hypothetical protein
MAHTNQLELYFGRGSSPGLYRTVFRPTTYPHPIVGIRGPLLQQQSLPFIWCTSCIALSILFVAAATEEAKGQLPLFPLLEGDQTSPAGAIGKLMNKGIRSWLHDVFGSDHAGRPLLNRMILLGNARGRRQGPITATIKTAYLSPKQIRIFLDGVDISTDATALTELNRQLEAEFATRKLSRHEKTALKKLTLPTSRAA